MTLGSYAQQSPCINPPHNPTGEQNELASQSSVQGFNAKSNEALTKALTPLKAPTPPLILPSIKDFFIKFMKVFMETTQAQAQAQTELQERPHNNRSPETYSEKSHINCYHFCQQCKDYFETLDTIGMNRIPFAASFHRGIISFRWAQHKRRH